MSKLTFDNSPNSSAIGTVTLPITGSDLAAGIDWGDGENNTNLSHYYSGAGPYTAVITVTSGTVTQFGNGSGATWSGSSKLTEVATTDTSTWGLLGISSFVGAFSECTTLTVVPIQIPVTVNDMSYMFRGASAFNQDISVWNISSVETMESMFAGATNFVQNIRVWNISSVTANGLDNMFDSNSTAMNNAYTGTTGYGPPMTTNFFESSEEGGSGGPVEEGGSGGPV